MKEIRITISTDYTRIPNKMHLRSQIDLPARVGENKRAYKRCACKQELVKTLKKINKEEL